MECFRLSATDTPAAIYYFFSALPAPLAAVSKWTTLDRRWLLITVPLVVGKPRDTEDSSANPGGLLAKFHDRLVKEAL